MNSTHHTAGPTVTELSEHKRALRLKIYQHSKSKDRATLQKGRNNILWLISKSLKEVAVEEADVPCSKVAPFKQKTPRPSLSKTPMTTSWEWTKSKKEPDDINSELFNHSKSIFSRPLAIIINSSFEHQVPIETLGEETPTRVRILPLAYLKGVSYLPSLHYRWRLLGPFSLPCAQKRS